MAIYESGEDYLETILELEQEKTPVRSIDVAAHLGFSKPSVSRAMNILIKNGYIEENIRSGIILTPEGRARAAMILERHETIASFLTAIGVPEDVALRDACKLEHDISDETYQAVSIFKKMAAK